MDHWECLDGSHHYKQCCKDHGVTSRISKWISKAQLHVADVIISQKVVVFEPIDFPLIVCCQPATQTCGQRHAGWTNKAGFTLITKQQLAKTKFVILCAVSSPIPLKVIQIPPSSFFLSAPLSCLDILIFWESFCMFWGMCSPHTDSPHASCFNVSCSSFDLTHIFLLCNNSFRPAKLCEEEWLQDTEKSLCGFKKINSLSFCVHQHSYYNFNSPCLK